MPVAQSCERCSRWAERRRLVTGEGEGSAVAFGAYQRNF